MAQGVALAVEDALVLAETLSSLTVREALAAYEQRRAPRIAWVRAQAHRRDNARGLTPPSGTRCYGWPGAGWCSPVNDPCWPYPDDPCWPYPDERLRWDA
jgi:hypothetical protein